MDEGFIVLYPLSEVEFEELKRIPIDFNVKMSTLEKRNNSLIAKT